MIPLEKINLLLILAIVSTSRKKLGIKQYCFQKTKSLFPLVRMKDWLKNKFLLKEKLLPLVAVDCCLRKWNKIVSTSQKISFH